MGVFSDQPDPPVYVNAVDTYDVVRYTDVSQAQWFMDRINFAYGGQATTNVRFDADGTTILWFGVYFLHLGDWLLKGDSPITDDALRTSPVRPLAGDWSGVDTGTVSEPATPPASGTTPATGA